MYQRILVPIDGSPTATAGLDEAIRLARLVKGSLRLVHVLDELVFVSGYETETGATYANAVLPMIKKAGEHVLEQGRLRVHAAGLPVEAQLLECFAKRTSEVVVADALAWKAELIVLGTHGRRGVGRFLVGSDAEQIVRSAPVPVLLVRGELGVEDAPVGRAPGSARPAKV